jgi:hypothetical protein
MANAAAHPVDRVLPSVPVRGCCRSRSSCALHSGVRRPFTLEHGPSWRTPRETRSHAFLRTSMAWPESIGWIRALTGPHGLSTILPRLRGLCRHYGVVLVRIYIAALVTDAPRFFRSLYMSGRPDSPRPRLRGAASAKRRSSLFRRAVKPAWRLVVGDAHERRTPRPLSTPPPERLSRTVREPVLVVPARSFSSR